MRRRIACGCVVAILLASWAHGDEPATRPVVFEGEKWAQRNVKLIEEAVAMSSPAPEDKERVSVLSIMSLSMGFNPYLWREPYLGRVVKTVEAGKEKMSQEDRQWVEKWLGEVKSGKAQRESGMGRDGMTLIRRSERMRPTDLLNAAPEIVFRRAYEEQIPAAIREAEQNARGDERMRRTEMAYLYGRLASDASRKGWTDWAGRHMQQVVEEVKAGAEFQDSRRGNTNGVNPGSAVRLLRQLGMEDELQDLIAALEPDRRPMMAEGLVMEAMQRGDAEAAKGYVRTMLEPAAAQRVVAAIEGMAIEPIAPTPAAPRQKQQPDPRLPEEVVRRLEWTLSKGVSVLQSNPEQERENLGDTVEALEATLSAAGEEKNGHLMARVAVQMRRLGHRERAKALILDAGNHIAGEDFGLGGTSDIVNAIEQMGRPDLLEKVYENWKEGRLLVCLIACRKAWFAGADLPPEKR